MVGGGGWEPSSTTALPIVSPFAADNSLARIVYQDVFGDLAVRPVTRAEAMRVPAMSRARHIIAGTIARIPLRGYRGDTVLDGVAEPTWIEQTTGALSPFHRMLWTVDDLIFYGWSCWARTNGYDGFPIRADRIPIGAWSVDAVGRVLVDAGDGRGPQYVQADSVILIPGPHEGLLSFAAESIRHAADLQRAAGTAAKHPSAYLVLKQTQNVNLSDADIDALIARWAAARDGANGGVGFASFGIDVDELGSFSEHLVVDGRNAAAVDIARHASIPADLVDATVAESSLHYTTSRDNDRRGIDYGMGLYMSAISGVFSQDAVTPRGQRVAFDLEEWLQGQVPGQTPTGQPAGPSSPTPPVSLQETPQ